MFSCVSPVFFVVVCNLNVIGLFFQILFFKFHVNKQKLKGKSESIQILLDLKW